MRKSIEAQIKINTIVVYLIIVALFVGMLVYIYSFRADLQTQKENIERYNAQLLTAQGLINQIEKAQLDVNLYVATKDSSYKKSYIQNITHVRTVIDSLKAESRNSSYIMNTLETLDSLLLVKGVLVTQLNDAIVEKDLLADVNQFLKNYKPKELNAIFLQKKQVERKDSVITKKAPKKSFFKKLGGLFSSKTEVDSVKINSQKVNQTSPNQLSMKVKDEVSAKIKRYVRRASTDYITQLSSIENRVNDLIWADQEITSNISSLLIDYFTKLIQARYNEIHRSDELIKQNNNYTLIGGLIALIPIVFSLITILQNVNKGKRARLALEEANARIREVMDTRHKLLLSVSHDIKAPLNSMMGNLEMNAVGKSIAKSDVHAMQNSGKHILSLLDNLLGFSSIEQGKLTLQPSSFHVLDLCAEVQDLITPLCQQKNLQFETQFDFDKNLTVNADSLRLKQIIINLLSNAVKYTLKGKVSFSMAYRENNLHVSVADTGVGVAKDQLDKIFEPFVRIEENNKIAEGNGFGMFVVKGLVELFGGTIEADSELGKGTSISLSIPALLVSTENKEEKRKYILIVDDDSALLRTLLAMVEKLGHRADICLSIDELKAKLSTLEKYDMVLTDMDMGAHSGLDTLEHVRKVNADIPVILTTTCSEMKKEQILKMGFSSCLPKPITKDVLSALLGKLTDFTEKTSVETESQEDSFPELKEMFGNDEVAMRDVLSVFVKNSRQDVLILQQSIQKSDFVLAQSTSHKMLTMFLQIDPTNHAIPFLKKMDSSRNNHQINYDNWKMDVRAIVDSTENLISKINDYLSC